MEVSKIKSSSLEKAKKLEYFLTEFEKRIFEKPLEIKIVESSERRTACSLFSRKGEPQFYLISIKDLNEYIISEVGRMKYFSTKMSGRSWKELDNFTEEEVILAIAAHEVRHRVQWTLQIKLLKPEDKENILDQELKLLISFLAFTFEESTLMKPEMSWFKDLKEFDAEVIAWLVAKLWHEGNRDLSKLAQIIKAGAEKIIKGDFPFFLLLFYTLIVPTSIVLSLIVLSTLPTSIPSLSPSLLSPTHCLILSPSHCSVPSSFPSFLS